MSYIYENGDTDAVLMAQLFDAMRISHEDLVFPKTQEKFGIIQEFAGAFEDSVPRIRQVMMRKPADVGGVDYIFNYIALQKNRISKKKELEAIENEIAMYE